MNNISHSYLTPNQLIYSNKNLYNTNKYHIYAILAILFFIVLSLFVFVPKYFNSQFHYFPISIINKKSTTHIQDYQTQSSLSLEDDLLINSTKQNIHKIRLLQGDDSSDSSTRTIQKYVLLLIIVFFVIVPVVAIIIFISLAIYHKCTQNQQQEMQNQAVNQIQLNMDQYNIDQMGPYISNPNDQCSICLDNQTNVRTYCGHFFHPICLKMWYNKKRQESRSPTCPVCIGTVTNPIKIYCKKCYVSVKLDILFSSSSNEALQQINLLHCNNCNIQEGKTSLDNETEFTDCEQKKGDKNQVETNKQKDINNEINNDLNQNEIIKDANIDKKQQIKNQRKKNKVIKRQQQNKQFQQSMHSQVKLQINDQI